ncbi:hypothetical protein DBV15_02488 [Temnothorax longispinosus]|uniref:Uncharacterized protein n=1 Tax=Temnothorax longispinosus TaxID=300112 RepID=A0A4S2KSK8_9HYME|nr:hypothetical protein DBV15_02488 [Temnothorax longispinosus]
MTSENNIKTVDVEKKFRMSIPSSCRWPILVAATLRRFRCSTYLSRKYSGLLSNELHVKSSDDSSPWRSPCLSLTRGREKKREKKAESRGTGICSPRDITNSSAGNRSLDRALKSELLDLAEVKNSRRARFDSSDFHSPEPIAPAAAARHSGLRAGPDSLGVSGGAKEKEENDETALRDGDPIPFCRPIA